MFSLNLKCLLSTRRLILTKAKKQNDRCQRHFQLVRVDFISTQNTQDNLVRDHGGLKVRREISSASKHNHMLCDNEKISKKVNQSNHWMVFNNLNKRKSNFNTDVEQSHFLFTFLRSHSDFSICCSKSG